MKHFKRKYLTALVIFTVTISVILVSLVILSLENEPIIRNINIVNTDDAVRVRTTAKKFFHNVRNSKKQSFVFSASEDDFNSLFALGHQSISKLSGSVKVSHEQFEILTSIKIPHNIIGDYLNIHIKIAPSNKDLHILSMSIGKVSIPGIVARFLISFTLDLLFGYKHGRELLYHINSIKLTDTNMIVHIRPIPDLEQYIQKMKKRLQYVRNQASIMGNPETVKIYYSKIIEIAEKCPAKKKVSLAYFIEPVFRYALNRNGNPVDENKAAILALAIYFGHWRIEQVIGEVRTNEMKQYRRKGNVVLANRVDLRLHFIISAALEIISAKNITFGIGEFKELLDADHGGSGFSFVDLAADRTGIKFAEVATNTKTAKRTQLLLSQDLHENHFFPNIKNLPERLSKNEFEHYFGNVQSKKYRSMVQDIDTCIESLPVYTREIDIPVRNECNIQSILTKFAH